MERSVGQILNWLATNYPSFKTELTYETDFQLLIAVILSAQCTDARVNQTTPALFAKYPDAISMSQASLPDLERLIHPCGFFKMKAKFIRATAQAICDLHEQQVPQSLEELMRLPGVGRKTASVVLNQAFGLPAIAVDTHVKRVSNRLGWTKHQDPFKVEMDLRKLLPESKWVQINGLLIWHGRRLCKARKPNCAECGLLKFCAYYRKNVQN